MLLGSPGASQFWPADTGKLLGLQSWQKSRLHGGGGSPRPDPERTMGEEGMEPWVRILHVLLSSWVSHFPSPGLCFLTDNTNR